jgi:hypothetical protein
MNAYRELRIQAEATAFVVTYWPRQPDEIGSAQARTTPAVHSVETGLPVPTGGHVRFD